MAREITNKLLEMVDSEILDRDILIAACLKYMSEDEVHDMAELNEFLVHAEMDVEDDFTDFADTEGYGYDEDDYEDDEDYNDPSSSYHY